jgi:hypothetical protein
MTVTIGAAGQLIRVRGRVRSEPQYDQGVDFDSGGEPSDQAGPAVPSQLQQTCSSLSRFSVTAGKDLKRSVLVYGGTESFDFKGVAIVPWNALWSGLRAARGIYDT